MNGKLTNWFNKNVHNLEQAYLLHSDPRKQSGFSGSQYKWTKCRKVIADCIYNEGTFLDIGCANGYLLQSVIRWKIKEGVKIVPYGVDIGEGLIELSKKRFPKYAGNFFIGNILGWRPPMKFDYVRTELVYVPEDYRKKLIERLLNEFVKSSGKLLLCEYRSNMDKTNQPWIDTYVKKYGFRIHEIRSGFFKGKELSRVVAISHYGRSASIP